MKDDIIKVGYYLVNGYWRDSGLCVSCYVDADVRGEDHPEKRSVRRD